MCSFFLYLDPEYCQFLPPSVNIFLFRYIMHYSVNLFCRLLKLMLKIKELILDYVLLFSFLCEILFSVSNDCL